MSSGIVTNAGQVGGRSYPFVWDAGRQQLRVQVFGAGRAVGRELAAELLAAGHPPERLALYGQRPTSFAWGNGVVRVDSIDAGLAPADLAIVCTAPELAASLVPQLLAQGTRVVDLSGAYRRDANTPLVVDAVNGALIGAFTELAAIPSRSSHAPIRLLSILEQAAGLESVDGFAVVAAASEGTRGILAVRGELAGAPAKGERRVGNLRPARGESGMDGSVERDIVADVRRMLDRPDLPMDVTAMVGDNERCDAYSMRVALRRKLAPEEASRMFAAAPGILVLGGPDGPSVHASAGRPEITVGRIRTGSRGPGSLCFFAVADQLRVGAAAAALRVASRMPAAG